MEIDREKGTNWKETFTFHSLYFQIGGWITYRDWWNAGRYCMLLGSMLCFAQYCNFLILFVIGLVWWKNQTI
jgi:hypothetical protein